MKLGELEIKGWIECIAGILILVSWILVFSLELWCFHWDFGLYGGVRGYLLCV